MTLPAGTISMSEVNTELGYSSTALISLNDTAVRTLAAVPSGQISMSDLQGKGGTFAATYSSNTTSGLNLRTWALANGWNGTAAATITIGSGVYLQSSSNATPALTINGSWPGGVTVIVNGYVIGAGGPGGIGNSLTGANGSAGGDAISLGINCSVQIGSNGGIFGGGGGGGSSYGGGGGGAGGGTGGTGWSSYMSTGGSGGFAGASGNNGVNGGNGSTYVGTGGGGGSGPFSSFPVYGGNGGTYSYGYGGASGGGGGGSSSYNSIGGQGGNTNASGGGTAGSNGANGGGGGGGGFGKAGGDGIDTGGIHFTGGAAGKGIALNGYTATLSGTTANIWGAVS